VNKEMKLNLTDDELYGMIKEADRDHDDKINVDEFMTLMRKVKLIY
jgi:Ca2+-binding EF-hand superfamily protein